MLETQHLILVPCGPWHYLALIEGIPQFNRAFGIPAAEGLRDFIISGEVSQAWVDQVRIAKAADPWVHGFAAVDRRDNVVVGMVGCKGPPDGAGAVEIAYGIVPGYQRRGYATEAAKALVQFASNDLRVQVIRAHTKSDNPASVRVLEKNGFSSRGEVVDPEDGLVWRWERNPIGRSNLLN